jgi:hypothetical protein
MTSWLDGEISELTALLMVGVVQPIIKAVQQISRDNQRAITSVTGVISNRLSELIEQQGEYLEPIIQYVSAMQQSTEDKAAVVEQQWASTQYMVGGKVSGGTEGLSTSQQAYAPTVSQVGEQSTIVSSPGSSQYQGGSSSGVTTNTDTGVESSNAVSVGPSSASVPSQAISLASERTALSTEVASVLDTVYQSIVSEQQILSSLSSPVTAAEGTAVPPTAQPASSASVATAAPVVFQVWYSSTGDPNTVVTSSADVASTTSLVGGGYALLNSYSSAAGWTQSAVIDQSPADVDVYLQSQAAQPAPANNIAGTSPSLVATAPARTQPPVDWWTQGTDWTLGGWDKKVKNKAAAYYGPLFSAVQDSGSIADAFAALDLGDAQLR